MEDSMSNIRPVIVGMALVFASVASADPGRHHEERVVAAEGDVDSAREALRRDRDRRRQARNERMIAYDDLQDAKWELRKARRHDASGPIARETDQFVVAV